MQKRLAGGREAYAAREAFQERSPGKLFELGDPLADSRDGEMYAFSGAREVRLLGDRDEELEAGQVVAHDDPPSRRPGSAWPTLRDSRTIA